MPKLSWKPWHEVVALRDDLKTGELSLNLFAADLYEVLMRSGKRPLYEDPTNFFARTHASHNLRKLVRDVAHRLARKNDKAVRQLELNYGGGKTHTLISLLHLHRDPAALPKKLPAVQEFIGEIGEQPAKARVVGLCFDKIDVEKGTEVSAPDGSKRRLLQPWSILAYQLLGDAGLKILHAQDKSEERVSPPAENLITQLLDQATADDGSVLILMDEVVMFARQKIKFDKDWDNVLEDFFQALTQAVVKAPGCCLVVSILASDPKLERDSEAIRLGVKFKNIFQRQQDEIVQPIEKGDVAEVLRRQFFKPESISSIESFKPHVIAALKGITEHDETTKKLGADAEQRFLNSYPFHPDLTEVFYAKWTNIAGFQKARGVLRVFALALREAEKWDSSPLVGPAVFLNRPDEDGLSEALRELVTIADGQNTEGKKQAWAGILSGELKQAREIEKDSVGLPLREIEQAVIAAFLHSQPTGRDASLRDLHLLISPVRPDKIELEKGLKRWAKGSYWLDDRFTAEADVRAPETWKLGNRPNLVQMHARSAQAIESDKDMLKARMIQEIANAKDLTKGAAAAGVRVHTLPARPRDVEDDDEFHYAVLGPEAASESGKPSPEACRFLNETTGPDKPRVYRNALILLTPTKDGVDLIRTVVRDYLAWESVRKDIADQSSEGEVDVARIQTLAVRCDEAKTRITGSIYQAYSTVVTVNEQNQIHAFKLSISDEPHFIIIKQDPRSRVKDKAITAEALLPDGPYNLWQQGQTSRRVKDLTGAFAQLPRLPKMLTATAILDTLVDGAKRGAFVLKLTRPDQTFRTWWHSEPDENARKDAALELVLPEHAQLTEIDPALIAKGRLPELWASDQIAVQTVIDYFAGGKSVTSTRVTDKGESYEDALSVPSASRAIVEAAVSKAIEAGHVWLMAGPASLCGEPIPAGVLTAEAFLLPPPAPISVTELLPEVLKSAWHEGKVTGLAIATGLSQKFQRTLPWRHVANAITDAIKARFLQVAKGSGDWPCDFAGAAKAIFEEPSEGEKNNGEKGGVAENQNLVGHITAPTDLVQEVFDALATQATPELLELEAKAGLKLKFAIELRFDPSGQAPTPETAAEIERVLKNAVPGFVVALRR